jgi:adenosylmethionine-8-amino-7-oxononanoate aminotransferase
MGLMGCVQCSEKGKARGDLGRDYEIGALIDQECQKRGLILRPIINMCVFSPPLIITEAEIHQMFDILTEGIEAATSLAKNP